MADNIQYYDEEFMAKFAKLKEMLEAEDEPALQRFLIDEFGCIFRLCQTYWKQAADSAGGFEGADEETVRELARPLSHRQYRMIERAFSPWAEERDLVLWSIWDFLDDEECIYGKKVMSAAEVGGCSLIYERVCCRLADGRQEKKRPADVRNKNTKERSES